MMKTNQIECPKCGTMIDVSEALSSQLRKENEAALAVERIELRVAKEALATKEQDLQALIEAQLLVRLSAEKDVLKAQLGKEFEEAYKGQVAGMTQELQEKSEQVKKLHLIEAEKSKLEREKSEMAAKYESDAQKRINEALMKEQGRIRQEEGEKSELRLKEREKTIEDLGRKLKEAQKRAEQGSMQLQGEVQELAIEEWLVSEFPLDTIQEIKKGARGGDCLQIVNTRQRTRCGIVYYESKRTMHFQPIWIEKFKDDMRMHGADVGVLVTEAMPSDMPRMGLLDGVWICTFPEFKALSHVMRDMMIRLDTVATTSKNRGDKMGMLYDYMTSNEFKLQMETIVEGFVAMSEDLESEKRSMSRIWKKREKQLGRVIASTSEMYGSVQGIAGAALPTIERLSLGQGMDDEEDESVAPDEDELF